MSLYVIQCNDAEPIAYVGSTGDPWHDPGSARKFSTFADAQAFLDTYHPGPIFGEKPFGGLDFEIKLLTTANAWEKGMRPAWEGEAKDAEPDPDELVMVEFNDGLKGWRPAAISFPNPLARWEAERDISKCIHPESFRITPYRPEASQS